MRPLASASVIMAASIYAMNARPELGEASLEPLVPTVEMVDALDERLAVGDQPRDHQARRSAQIGGHHGRAREPLDSVHPRRIALDLDLSPEAAKLLNVHEAVLENGLGHAGRALGDGVERDELRLHVRRESRIG